MVNKKTGEWRAEKDYSKYPKRKWCNMDYIANWIYEQEYRQKTSVENIVTNILVFYDNNEDVLERGYFALPDRRESPKNLMINVEDVVEFIAASGGIKEFDYIV